MRSDERKGDMADDPPISVSNYNKTTLLGVSGDEVKTSIPPPAGREATGGGDGGDEDRPKSIPGEGCDNVNRMTDCSCAVSVIVSCVMAGRRRALHRSGGLGAGPQHPVAPSIP